jgi:DNA-binding transcriptional regulator/RsmH inhibitor MraZ
VGEFEHAIDEKGRLVLPSVFRGAFEEGAVLATRPDGCVGLMTSDRFEQEAQEIRHNAPPSSRPQYAMRRPDGDQLG